MEMRGDITNDPFHGTARRMNDNALRLGDGRVDTAQLADINKTLVGNIIHRHRNFVGVGGEHQPGASPLVQHRHAIAIGVGEGFIRERLDVIKPDPLATNFVTGGAGRVNEGPQKVQGWLTHAGNLPIRATHVERAQTRAFAPRPAAGQAVGFLPKTAEKFARFGTNKA